MIFAAWLALVFGAVFGINHQVDVRLDALSADCGCTCLEARIPARTIYPPGASPQRVAVDSLEGWADRLRPLLREGETVTLELPWLTSGPVVCHAPGEDAAAHQRALLDAVRGQR